VGITGKELALKIYLSELEDDKTWLSVRLKRVKKALELGGFSKGYLNELEKDKWYALIRLENIESEITRIKEL
jgi:hypothetical protein